MNSKMDPMGRAIADYWKTKKADRLRVFLSLIASLLKQGVEVRLISTVR